MEVERKAFYFRRDVTRCLVSSLLMYCCQSIDGSLFLHPRLLCWKNLLPGALRLQKLHLVEDRAIRRNLQCTVG